MGLSIKEFIIENFYSINENETISKALGIMHDKKVKGLIVTQNNGSYAGIITEEIIKKSYLDPVSTKVKSLTIKAPKNTTTESSVYEAAYNMFHSQIPILPIFDKENNENVIGVIEIKDFLHKYLQKDKEYANRKVIEVATTDVVTIHENDTIGKALKLYRENKFTRLPVIGKNGKLVGIITLIDIIEKILKPKHRETKPRTKNIAAKEKIHVVDYPVKEVMNSVVFTIDGFSTLKEAINIMIENNISSLVVTDDENIAGIITDKDILGEIASKYVKPEKFIIIPSISGDVEDLDKFELEKSLTHIKEVLERYEDYLKSGRIYVFIKEHKEKFRSVPLYYVKIRASTEKGLFISTGQTWGLYNALGNALHHLKDQIKYKKEIESDPYLGLKRLVKEVADTTVLPRIKGENES